MTSRVIQVPLARIEAEHLAELIDEFTTVIAAADYHRDTAVERLVPSPYPQDPEASAEFATATRDELLDRRTADAAVVRSALAAIVDQDGSAEADDAESPSHIDVIIRAHDLDAWLRTLTALRLVIAARLNITDDDDLDDPRFDVFHWLGYRLDNLITVADALDDLPGDDSPTGD